MWEKHKSILPINKAWPVILAGLAIVLIASGGCKEETNTAVPQTSKVYQSNWTKFRGDAGNTGVSSGILSGGTLKWAIGLSMDPNTTPAISKNGIVYLGTNNGELIALDGESGQKLWTVKLSGYVSNSSPAIGEDGTVYIGMTDGDTLSEGYVYGIDGSNGRIKWTFKTGGRIASSPAIGEDNTVYIRSNDGCLYGIDGSNGQKRWVLHADRWGWSSPAVGKDGTLYIGSVSGKVYGIDGNSGKIKWLFETGGEIASSPVAGEDGTVYIVSLDKYMYALNGKDGPLKWKTCLGFKTTASPAIAGNKLYIGSYYASAYDQEHPSEYNEALYSIDCKSGKMKRIRSMGNSSMPGSPAISGDNKLVIGTYTGRIIAFDLQKGYIVWEQQITKWLLERPIMFRTSPAISADGTVYICGSNGFLYAVK